MLSIILHDFHRHLLQLRHLVDQSGSVFYRVAEYKITAIAKGLIRWEKSALEFLETNRMTVILQIHMWVLGLIYSAPFRRILEIVDVTLEVGVLTKTYQPMLAS